MGEGGENGGKGGERGARDHKYPLSAGLLLASLPERIFDLL